MTSKLNCEGKKVQCIVCKLLMKSALYLTTHETQRSENKILAKSFIAGSHDFWPSKEPETFLKHPFSKIVPCRWNKWQIEN